MLSGFLHQGCNPFIRAQGQPTCCLHWIASPWRWRQEVERFWLDTIGATWEYTGEGIEIQQMAHTLRFGQQIGSILGSHSWRYRHTSGHRDTACLETGDFQRIVRQQSDRRHPQILQDEGGSSVVSLVLVVSEE